MCKLGERCDFNHDIDHSQKPIKSTDSSRNNENICRHEAEAKGSCPWGEKCKFNHDIAAKMKKDHVKSKDGNKGTGRQTAKLNGQQIKTALCIHEFEEKGTCQWGENCKFSHDITEDTKKDQEITEKISLIRKQVVGNVLQEYGSKYGDKALNDPFLRLVKVMIQQQENPATNNSLPSKK